MELSKIIEETASYFEADKRTDGTDFVKCDWEKAPKELRDSVREAHGDRFPNDWIYATYSSILDRLGDYTIEHAEHLDDYRHEIVDSLVDCYTHDLEKWLADSNSHYIDAVITEYGYTPDSGGAGILAQAQYMAIDEIYGEVQRFIVDSINE